MLSLLLVLSARPAHIPAIARIFGAKVGYDGELKIERLLGEGEHVMGGHPNSKEIWFAKAPNSMIQTDGFVETNTGYVLESLEWETVTHRGTKHEVTRTKGWLGCILLGDSKSNVLRKTATLLPKPKKNWNGSLSWNSSGFTNPDPRNGPSFTKWFAILTFDKHGCLAKIELDAM